MRNDALICGIDPGSTKGGWALIDTKGKVHDAGFVNMDRKEQDRLFDALEMADYVALERAQASKQMGVSSSFIYGRAAGIAEGAALAIGCRVFYLSPSWWKARIAVPADKKRAVSIALQRMPSLKPYVTLAKHDGIAEAALIGSVLLNRRLFQELLRLEEAKKKPKRKRVNYKL